MASNLLLKVKEWWHMTLTESGSYFRMKQPCKNKGVRHSGINITNRYFTRLPCSTTWGMTAGPNPTNGLLDVKFSGDDQELTDAGMQGTLQIKDNVGNLKQSLSIHTTDKTSVDLSNYVPGMYYLNFVSPDVVLNASIAKQ